MRKYCNLILMLLCVVILSGCAKEEEPIPVPTETVYVPEACEWDGKYLDPITDLCKYVTYDDSLEIFPDYQSSSYIKVRKIIYSDVDFWEVLKANCSDTSTIVDNGTYGYLRLSDGSLVGYGISDDTYAYLITSEELTDFPIEALMEMLWNTNT